MKPHPHIRTTIKWGGAAVTALFAVVWIGSAWVTVFRVCASGRIIGLVAGKGFCTEAMYAQGSQFTGWAYGVTRAPDFEWWFGWPHPSPYAFYALPLWVPVCVSLAITAAAFRLDALARRRARGANLCPNCNYDRTGLVGGAAAVCPECGTNKS